MEVFVLLRGAKGYLEHGVVVEYGKVFSSGRIWWRAERLHSHSVGQRN